MKAPFGLAFAALLLASLLSNSVVFAQGGKADCVRDGKSYPHGTVLGGYICINGTWQKL